jgi:hypothetical protein
MKSGNTSKITAIAVACLSLGMYAMAQRADAPRAGRATGMQNSGAQGQNQSMNSQQQNQSMQSQNMTTTTTNPNVKTSPTPRGHHFGWEKGRHNPHRSASPNASVTAKAVSTASPQPTANLTTPPPLQSP